MSRRLTAALALAALAGSLFGQGAGGSSQATDLAEVEAQLALGADRLSDDDLAELWSSLDSLRLEVQGSQVRIQEQQRKLRGIFDEIGWADQAALFDEMSATALLTSGHPHAADELLARGGQQLDDGGPRRAFYAAERADLARLEHNWADCFGLLDEAQAALQDEHRDRPLWFEARALSAGVRGQAELFLGRLRPAWLALEDERLALEQLGAAFPERAARTSSLLTAADFRRIEFKLFTDRHDEVRQDVLDALESPDLEGELTVRLTLLGALASAADEINHPDLHSGAATGLENLLGQLTDDPQLELRTLLTLARLALAHKDQSRATDWLTAAEPIAPLAPERERADLAALKGRLALARGDSADELETSYRSLASAAHDLILSWGQIPPLAGGVGLFHDGIRRELFGTALALSDAFDQPERGLELLLEAQAQGALARSLAAEAPTLQALQQSLLAEAGALVYLPTAARTHLALVDSTGVLLLKLESGPRLTERVRKLHSLPETSRPAALAALGTELLPALAREKIATWSCTYITGAELLDHPPFTELPFDRGTFASKVAFAYLPSLVVGARLEERWPAPADAGPHAASIVAALSPSEEALPPLPIESATLRALADTLDAAPPAHPADLSALAKGFSATSLCELIGHGVHDSGRPVLPTGIALDAGRFFGDELTSLKPTPTLVALGVCGAARAPTRRGEDGAGSLGGALFAAGTSSVLLSHEDLEVTATLELLDGFNRSLAGGVAPSEALRRTYQAGAPADLGLAIFGLGHRPVFRARATETPSRLLFSLGGLLLFGMIALLARRLRAPS